MNTHQWKSLPLTAIASGWAAHECVRCKVRRVAKLTASPVWTYYRGIKLEKDPGCVEGKESEA